MKKLLLLMSSAQLVLIFVCTAWADNAIELRHSLISSAETETGMVMQIDFSVTNRLAGAISDISVSFDRAFLKDVEIVMEGDGAYFPTVAPQESSQILLTITSPSAACEGLADTVMPWKINYLDAAGTAHEDFVNSELIAQ